jgi:hypothetical protein
MFSTFTLLAGLVLGAPPLDAGERAQVEQGEVVVKRLTPTGDAGVSARAYGIVDAPPAEVFPVVRDCAYFHEFMPRTKNSKLVSQQGPVALCEVEISMPFPISNLVATTRSTNKRSRAAASSGAGRSSRATTTATTARGRSCPGAPTARSRCSCTGSTSTRR